VCAATGIERRYLSVLVGQLAGDASAARRARFYERSHSTCAWRSRSARPGADRGGAHGISTPRAQADDRSGAVEFSGQPVARARRVQPGAQSVALGHPSQARTLLALAKGSTTNGGPRLPSC